MAYTIDDFINEAGLDRAEIDEYKRRMHQRIEAYRLMEIRKRQDMTQAQLAEKMGVTQKRVSQLERGDIDGLRVGTIGRYVAGLGGKPKLVIDLPGEEPIAIEA